MAFLTDNVRVQVAVPPGMITVSPLVAEAIAAATSDSDALFALIVVAPAKRASSENQSGRKRNQSSNARPRCGASERSAHL